MSTLTFEEAQSFLNQYKRWSLSDGTFGGTDVGWVDDDGKMVANGWFEAQVAEIHSDLTHPLTQEQEFSFVGEEARQLRYCGKSAEFTRNDPDEDTDRALVRSDPGILADPSFVPNHASVEELELYLEDMDGVSPFGT